MATLTFGKYFSSSISVTTGTTTQTNDFDTMGLSWTSCVQNSMDIATHINNENSSSTSLYLGNSHSIPTYAYSGEVWFRIIYYNSNSVESGIFRLCCTVNNGVITYDQNYLTNTINALSRTFPPSQSMAGGFYFDGVECYDFKCRFKNADGKLLFSTLTPLTNNAYTGSIDNLSKGGNIPKLVFNMTVVQHSVEYTTGTRYFRNYTTSNAAMYLASGTMLRYTVTPTFLDAYKTTAYNMGYCGTAPYSEQANHQDYITNNSESAIDALKTTYTKSESFNANTIYQRSGTFITAMTAVTANTTHTVTWTANKYEMYRNTAQTQKLTDYNTFNLNSVTYVTIYPKVLTTTCHDTFYFCFYDVDEGINSCSYYSTSSVYRYKVPPTDMIKSIGSNFSGSTAMRNSYGVKTIIIWYGSNPYNIGNGGMSPTAKIPAFAKYTITTAGETFPSTPPSGMFEITYYNYVMYGGSTVPVTSVRYHWAGLSYNYSLVQGSLVPTGSAGEYNRDNILYIPLKKNTKEFVSRISSFNPGGTSSWNDTINGVTYTQPVAYADMASTLHDLHEKMTCYHGCAYGLYLGGNNTLLQIKNSILSTLWTNNLKDQFEAQEFAKKSRILRCLEFSINGDDYEIYEKEGSIRYKENYPCWSDPASTSFTYVSGLCVKHHDEGKLILIDIPENMWSSVLSGVTIEDANNIFCKIINYNGYILNNNVSVDSLYIYSDTSDNFNYYNRKISNVVTLPADINQVTAVTAGPNVTLTGTFPNCVITSPGDGTNSYFMLKLRENIVAGRTYTICMYADVPHGYYWNFLLGNNNMAITWNVTSGFNTKTFTANSANWGTKQCLLDGISSSTARYCGLPSKFSNFMLYQANGATDEIDLNIIHYDWIQNDTNYFGGKTTSAYQRSILAGSETYTEVTGYTFSVDHTTLYGYDGTGQIINVDDVLDIRYNGSSLGQFTVEDISAKDEEIYLDDSVGGLYNDGITVYIVTTQSDNNKIATNSELYTTYYEP